MSLPLEDFYNTIDFSRIIGYPCELPKADIENLPDLCNNGDANSHIKAFWWCIGKWCGLLMITDV
jgi:hypothetical protein